MGGKSHALPKSQKLSSSSQVTLQPWLLQHYTGTTGLRVELMLANLVAEKYTSIYEVDWVEMARSSDRSINQSNIILKVCQGVFWAHLRQPAEHLHESPCSECQDEAEPWDRDSFAGDYYLKSFLSKLTDSVQRFDASLLSKVDAFRWWSMRALCTSQARNGRCQAPWRLTGRGSLIILNRK